MQGQDRHDLVAVDQVAVGVHREAAVGVTVEGDAQVGAVLDHRGLQATDVGGTGIVVDVEPVGGVVHGDDSGTGRLECGHCGRRRCTVGGIDDDLQAVEPHVTKAGDQRVDVAMQ